MRLATTSHDENMKMQRENTDENADENENANANKTLCLITVPRQWEGRESLKGWTNDKTNDETNEQMTRGKINLSDFSDF